MFPPHMSASKTFQSARQIKFASTGTAVYLGAHKAATGTHPLMCLPVDHNQLFLPSGPGRVIISVRGKEADIFPLMTYKRGVCTASMVKALIHAYVFIWARRSPACTLPPPPYINHRPPSNEDERTESLKHLILPQGVPNDGMDPSETRRAST